MNIINKFRNTIADKIDKLKERSSSAPKVACPKCKSIHDINADSRCPECGARYKLPPEYAKYTEMAAKKKSEEAARAASGADTASVASKSSEKAPTSVKSDNTERGNPSSTQKSAPKKATDKKPERRSAVFSREESERAMHKISTKNKLKKSGRLVLLCSCAIIFSVVFIVFMLMFFKDKDALVLKLGEYEQQPVFYITESGTLNCLFPNEKNTVIGKGKLGSYLASTDGKTVYLTYTGEFGSDKVSNYVLRISDFAEEPEEVFESKDRLPKIIAGGDNGNLYIMNPQNDIENIYDLYLSADGKEPTLITHEARELAVSSSGRYALVSVNDSGASKLMLYSLEKDSLSPCNIRNAHPISIDNKGEYMIYALKPSAESTSLVAQKTQDIKVTIPIFTDTVLEDMILSEDKRSFALQYSDRTVFYDFEMDDYETVPTTGTTALNYRYNDNISHNLLAFSEIPHISNIRGTELLPYCYYDNSYDLIYRINEKGVKEALFPDHPTEEFKISDDNHIAFVSSGFLFSARLDGSSTELKRVMSFNNKKLLDISPDGKNIYYTDVDGAVFRVETGKEDPKAEMLTDKAQFIKCSDKGTVLAVNEGTAHIIDNDADKKLLCEGIIPELSVVPTADMSEIIYVKKTSAKEDAAMNLYLYSGKKSKLITDKLAEVCAVNEKHRIDRSKSYYFDITEAKEEAQDVKETQASTGDTDTKQ